MTPAEAVLDLVVAVAAAAGVHRSIEGERRDRWHRWLFELLRLRRVAFRGLGVGCFGIRCLMLGIRGRAFAGCIFERALSIQSVSILFMRDRNTVRLRLPMLLVSASCRRHP